MQSFEWRHVDKDTRGDDWHETRALDEWMAAKAAADQWDSEDRRMIMSGASHVFEVRDAHGKVTLWSVWGEAQPYYYATPIAENH